MSGAAEPGSTVTRHILMAPLQQSWQAQTEHGQYQTRNLVDGDTVTATATDPAGNISLPVQTVSADITPPVVALMMC